MGSSYEMLKIHSLGYFNIVLIFKCPAHDMFVVIIKTWIELHQPQVGIHVIGYGSVKT